MADKDNLEKKVEELTRQLEALSRQVNPPETRLENPAGADSSGASPAAPRGAAVAEEPEDISEELLSWAHKAALLPRLATLCFLLVIALGLRAITDYKMIETLLGSALGMGYAATLIGVAWYKYRRGSPLAPVFAACGAVLMSVIVLETHTRFQALPLVPAYMTLMATGVAMAVISYQFNVFVPISLGTLGMCLAGAAIDFPNPFFPYLSMVLWTATILGYFAARLKRCSWLRWTLLVVTMLMFSQWGIKLGQALYGKETPAAALAQHWFLPVIAVFAVTYAGIALLGIFRYSAARISRFDFFIPAVNAAFSYAIAYYVVGARGTGHLLLGWVGIACSIVYFGLAFRLAVLRTAAGAGANSFILAAATLLALALPAATGSFLLSLPVLGVAAFFLVILSRQWQNGGARAISYLIQLYAAGAMAVFLQSKSGIAVDVLTVIPTGLLAVSSLYHYQLCRKSPPPENSTFFTGLDRHDRSAVLLLLAALGCSFFMMRAAVYQVLVMMPGDIANSYRCAQSVLINIAAAGLMLFAVFRRNKEIRNVAILVTLIGASKVFLYDMLGTHGFAQVVSIFTFGLVAALESIMLGRWPRTPPEEGAHPLERENPIHPDVPGNQPRKA